jgi:hypothetical protein
LFSSVQIRRSEGLGSETGRTSTDCSDLHGLFDPIGPEPMQSPTRSIEQQVTKATKRFLLIKHRVTLRSLRYLLFNSGGRKDSAVRRAEPPRIARICTDLFEPISEPHRKWIDSDSVFSVPLWFKTDRSARKRAAHIGTVRRRAAALHVTPSAARFGCRGRERLR